MRLAGRTKIGKREIVTAEKLTISHGNNSQPHTEKIEQAKAVVTALFHKEL